VTPPSGGAGGVWIVTGISAAGKSPVAAALADRFERSVHVEGDAIRAFVRRGRTEMTPGASAAALDQLRLRYGAAASIADRYAAAGFTVVWDDVIVGPLLADAIELVTARPRRLVVLAPRADVVAAREAGRTKSGYHAFDVEGLDRTLRTETSRIGLWLDTSELTVEETVDAVLRREADATI
jgi:chloramphenicol 3-O-phosphotransferase